MVLGCEERIGRKLAWESKWRNKRKLRKLKIFGRRPIQMEIVLQE
jgi:hypothetical protein